MNFNRRQFLTSAAMASGFALCPVEFAFPIDKITRLSKPKVIIGLNAYSFNALLIARTMNYDDLLVYCANNGIEAVDLTGYYFLSYPIVPSDEEIYKIKRKAFLLRVSISGTGIRNDFTIADKEQRKKEVQLVKNWVLTAEKLGAPCLRIFTGNSPFDAYSRKEVLDWMVNDLKECADFAGQHGVMLAVQNHNDFLKTAGQIEELLKRVNSDWLGLMLDIGGFQSSDDPYKEIEQVLPYAVNWQIKESVYLNKIETPTDLSKIAEIIKRSSYRGYLPIETIDKDDPKEKFKSFYLEVKDAMKEITG
jgi:sugar phosphate isomerase/epimerase